MKTVNKITILVCLILAVSCTNHKSEIYDKNVSTIYLLDIFGDSIKYNDEDKDTVILEKRIFAKDSCFGAYNEKNTLKAYRYADKHDSVGVYIYYLIKCKNHKTGLFQTLFEIEHPEEYALNIELRQGYVYKQINKNNKYYKEYRYVFDKKCLKVIQTFKGSGNMDFNCLNFEIDDNLNWTLISKEKLETNPPNEFRHYGYCVDTVSKVLNTNETHIPKNYINLFEAFYWTTIDWECQ